MIMSLLNWKKYLLQDESYKEVYLLDIKKDFIKINNINEKTSIRSVEKRIDKQYFKKEDPSKTKPILFIISLLVMSVILMTTSNDNISNNIKSIVFYLSMILPIFLFFLYFSKNDEYIIKNLHILEIIAENREIILKSNDEKILEEIEFCLTETPMGNMDYHPDNEGLFIIIKEIKFE